jgi:ankyrin repeat protein
MSDALPIPLRPDLDFYRTLARDLQTAVADRQVRPFVERWAARLGKQVDIGWYGERGISSERVADWIERQWRRFADKQLGLEEPPSSIKLTDAQFFMAHIHDFPSWPRFAHHVEAMANADSLTVHFEAAADAIVTGDIDTLRRLLREHPELVRARSTRGHGSTLLHYVSANGVEDFRQHTPPNIVAITELLLDAGADVNAESEAYGGKSTTLGLAATSIHPERAGVQIPLLELLLGRGADIEQRGQAGNQHSAIWGCLANGQGEAARFLAQRGAPMNLAEAAGVGRLDVVKTCLDESGGLDESSLRRQLEDGFFYGCGYGHAAIVDYFLERGADASTRNARGETGLHWALYGPHLDVVDVLLRHGAPVDARDAQQGTALDWAVNGWAHASDQVERERLAEAAARLVRAGAPLTLSWYDQNERRRQSLKLARSDSRMRTLLAERLCAEG